MYNYNCPDCNETKLQTDKNARKINEVIEQVNALIQVNNETVDFIEEKTEEKVEEIAELKVNEVLGDIKTSLDNISVNVKDFGAKGDGVTDDTEAFNKATKAVEEHVGNSTNINHIIYIPQGNYIIKGTVYIRKGQTLQGSGSGSSRIIIPNESNKITFKCGYNSNNIEDNKSGLPYSIKDIGFEGGSGTALYCSGSGYFLDNCFFTGCGKAIHVRGGDWNISNIIIDMGLIGLHLDGSNGNINNLICYECNWQIYLDGDGINDVNISNSLFEYTKMNSIVFSNSTYTNNFNISNCSFILNTQYDSFTGFILDMSQKSDININNCSFRNMQRFAISITGTNSYMKITDCVFNGERTNENYTQSSTPLGVTIDGNATINNCEFLNLNTAIEYNGDKKIENSVNGNVFKNIGDSILYFNNSNIDSKIIFKNNDCYSNMLINKSTPVLEYFNNNDMLKCETSGEHYVYKIPFKNGMIKNIKVSGNTSPAGNPIYRNYKEFKIGVIGDYNGSLVYKLKTENTFSADVSGYINELDVNILFSNGEVVTSNGDDFIILKINNSIINVNIIID